MSKRVVIYALIVSVYFSTHVIGQQRNDLNVEKTSRPKTVDLFVNITTSGAGAGFKLQIPTNDPDTHLNFGIQFDGVKGEKDVSFFDPYTYQFIRKRDYWTTMVPMMFGVKRRLWREEIESDFRPYVTAEIGPVFGIAFPTGDGFSKGVSRGKGQISAGGFIGFGIDFGSTESSTYGVTLGVHLFPFPKNLGEKDVYRGFSVRVNFVNFFN
ncbi:hypothetical protein ACFL6I_00310 [candidate division KSB1 bacterium]